MSVGARRWPWSAGTRLLETYLVSELGYGWDEVHDEAEVLEHAVSDRLMNRIDAKLGHPSRDPHGDPILPDGEIASPRCLLADMRDGETGVIARISDTDPAMLRYFDEVGITLDRLVRIADKRPFAGTTTITVDDVEPAITLGDVATRDLRRDQRVAVRDTAPQWSCSPIRWTWMKLVEPTVAGGAPATMTTTSPSSIMAALDQNAVHLVDHLVGVVDPVDDERLGPQLTASWLRIAGIGVNARSGNGECSRANRRTVSPDWVKATSAFTDKRSPMSRAA